MTTRTSMEKMMVRRVVGNYRDLKGTKRAHTEQLHEALKRLQRRRQLLDECHAEVAHKNTAGRAYSREDRERIEQEGTARIAACEREVRDTEAHVAAIKARIQALEADIRPAALLAESLLNALDAKEPLREELGGSKSYEVAS